MRIRVLSVVLLSLVLATMGSLVIRDNAGATHIACGDTLTSNTTLDSDINCSGTAILIGASDITLDCNNHTISGTGSGTGIGLAGRTGVTVQNCTVLGFSTGISLYNPNGGGNNTLKENTLLSNNRGIRLASSSGNVIQENSLSGNFLGIRVLSASNDNAILENKVANTTANAVNLQFSSGNVVRENMVSNNGHGISLFSSTANLIEANTVFNNRFNPISVVFANNNTFTENVSKWNGGDGYSLVDSDDNTFQENSSTSNAGDGFDADSNSINNNFIENMGDENVGVGYRDASSGAGTAGTSNTYSQNNCNGNLLGTSYPLGLCGS